MGPAQIVVGPPFLNDLAGMTVAAKAMHLEAFISPRSVECLDKTILHRLARRDVVPFDATILPPGVYRVGSWRRPVGVDRHAGIAAPRGGPIRFAGHLFARRILA